MSRREVKEEVVPKIENIRMGSGEVVGIDFERDCEGKMRNMPLENILVVKITDQNNREKRSFCMDKEIFGLHVAMNSNFYLKPNGRSMMGTSSRLMRLNNYRFLASLDVVKLLTDESPDLLFVSESQKLYLTGDSSSVNDISGRILIPNRLLSANGEIILNVSPVLDEYDRRVKRGRFAVAPPEVRFRGSSSSSSRVRSLPPLPPSLVSGRVRRRPSSSSSSQIKRRRPTQVTIDFQRQRLNGRTTRIVFNISTIEAIGYLVESNPEMLTKMHEALDDDRFRTYVWETPRMDSQNTHKSFEFVLVNTPMTNRANISRFTRINQIQRQGVRGRGAISFDSPSKTRLIIPENTGGNARFANIAEFNRHANKAQQASLWKLVAVEYGRALSSVRPIWLSTSGLEVPWLHVRVSKTPRYYKHRPYMS